MKNILLKNKGFNLFELILAMSILVLTIAIIVPSLSTFRNTQSLKNTTDDIVSLLNQARMQTLSSQNSTYYSVHFEGTRAVLFTGGTFSNSNSTNKVITFDLATKIPASGGINLNGSGVDVNFTRLTGDTNQYGTIVVQLTSNATKQKTITINKLGIASVN